ncbi:GNAT family N-acetyltransferase [Massilia sp. W12]|uniref:GNAT family N-acetyltransferase n=1 Tax=Massilia sp. W12 TaxID=3126507 RepID=UPI0030D556CE
MNLLRLDWRYPLAPGVLLRALEPGDAAALLKFERDNRAWFERFIEPRGAFFYWPDGVQAHVQEFCAAMQSGQLLALLLEEDGAIIGRINLHGIARHSARIGYRQAQHACGRGLTSLAVAQVCHWAQERLDLHNLRTWVVQENAASARVLHKNGFVLLRKGEKKTPLAHGQAVCDGWWKLLQAHAGIRQV